MRKVKIEVIIEAEDDIILGEWDMAADRTTTLTVNGGTLFAKRILKTYSGKKPTTVLNINGRVFHVIANLSDLSSFNYAILCHNTFHPFFN